MTWLNLIKRVAGALNAERRPDTSDPIPVGRGDPNERQFYVHGVPHLLRMEADRVVHFVGVFEHRLQRTQFGDKLLPEVFPRWKMVGEHPNTSLEQVAVKVIQQGVQHDAPRPSQSDDGAEVRRRDRQKASARDPQRSVRQDGATTRAGNVAFDSASSSAYTVGELLEWGEMTFPNRKPSGPRTYTSFALKLATTTGEKILQGEGLKDALADAGCKLGDRIAVKRLHREKVAAFDKKSGSPIMDRTTGEQKLWDRWVWTINLVH